jgi:uncharacterized membrane protein YhaH (DUF805 family)
MSDINFCPFCGKSVVAGAHFCGECGKELPGNTAPKQTVPQQQTTISAVLQNQPPKTPQRTPDEGFYENFVKKDGRLNRLRYFKRTLVVGIVGIILYCIVAVLIDDIFRTKITEFILAIAAASTLPFQYSLNVRRLCDIGKKEFLAECIMYMDAIMYFMPAIFFPWQPPYGDYGFIPPDEPLGYLFIGLSVISCVLSLYLLFAPGTHGENQYGPDPLQ